MQKNTKLIREQLQATLQKFEPLKAVQPPLKGWIRAIRDALGMNGRQFADRLGEHRSRTQQMEQQELNGSLTMKTMHKTARALDCVFVYGFVPRTSLEDTVRAQVRHIASRRLTRASHTMELENQELGIQENQEILENLVEKIMRDLPANLWDN